MTGKNPINTTIIPPLTDVSPIIKVEEFENEFRMTAGYLPSAIDEMAKRVNDRLDEELMARLAEQHGYVKPIRCRDCEYADPEPPSDKRSRKDYQGGYWCEYWSEGIGAFCPANGYCHAGKPRVKACRNADENAAAFADAPTQETAREPMRPPTFELGA